MIDVEITLEQWQDCWLAYAQHLPLVEAGPTGFSGTRRRPAEAICDALLWLMLRTWRDAPANTASA